MPESLCRRPKARSETEVKPDLGFTPWNRNTVWNNQYLVFTVKAALCEVGQIDFFLLECNPLQVSPVTSVSKSEFLNLVNDQNIHSKRELINSCTLKSIILKLTFTKSESAKKSEASLAHKFAGEKARHP